jgi:hypothetical protein
MTASAHASDLAEHERIQQVRDRVLAVVDQLGFDEALRRLDPQAAADHFHVGQRVGGSYRHQPVDGVLTDVQRSQVSYLLAELTITLDAPVRIGGRPRPTVHMRVGDDGQDVNLHAHVQVVAA